jgi:probable HAF family extracellular repeat protein
MLLWLLTSANAAHAQNGWTITDLGTLGGDSSNAEDINEAGHVVGGSQTSSDNVVHAFLWTPSGMIDLGTLGGTRSEAFGINNTGQVVGNSMPLDPSDPFPPAHAFLWTAGGGMLDLGALGELFPGFGRGASGANDVNDAGQVVGETSIGNGESHAYVWTLAGGMVDLGTLGGANSRAVAINEAGQIVGRSDTASGDQHAFLWTMATGMIDLGTLGGLSSSASDINESGVVVGRAATASGDEHAFVWTEAGGMVDLGSPGGAGTRSQAESINDNGEVVGLWNDGDDFAFYWTASDGLVELPTLTGIESGARAINNAGQAAGYGDIETGDGHAVVWSRDDNPPAPEEQIESLAASVQALVAAGNLNAGQANGLTRPLGNALRSLERGHPAAACSQLFDFQVEVTRKVLDGALTAGQGVALIDTAASIRAAVGC